MNKYRYVRELLRNLITAQKKEKKENLTCFHNLVCARISKQTYDACQYLYNHTGHSRKGRQWICERKKNNQFTVSRKLCGQACTLNTGCPAVSHTEERMKENISGVFPQMQPAHASLSLPQ